MSYTRRISVADAGSAGYPHYLASRDTDRLVIVTEGQLNTEIAARPGPAPAEAVIVIPAGVPHRIWSSSAPVRYLDVDLQTPPAYAKLAIAAD